MVKSDELDERLVRNLNTLPPQLRLIDTRPENQSVSVLDREIVRRLVESTGLDLISMQPEASPPVYKLLDYGKFRYTEQKRLKEVAKRQRETTRSIKEFLFSPGLAQHDFEVKLAHIREALERHDVRVQVKLDRRTRLMLPRGMHLGEASRQPDFVLRRVLDVLASDEVACSDLQVGERMVFAMVKKKVAVGCATS